MQELQRLSELVVRARADGGDFHAWAGRADEALQDRSHEVAQQVADLTDGRQRALLFTAAMLDEAPAATVFRFADRLLSRLGHPEDERPRLDRTDLTRRLHELPVKVRGERIHFEGLAYAAAIRTHFWLYYPDLRAAFGDWVADAVTEFAWLGPADRNHFVARYTEHALKADDVRTLTDLVESWATDGKLLPEAELVLALGLMSDARGSAFRAKIYEWAVKPGLSSQLARLLTRTCVEAMAPLYPDQALVRLHHLARREGDHGRPDSAQTALLELVRQNHALCVRLLNRVCSGMEKHEFADVGIFLVLMDPLPGWVQHDVAVRGWRGVLDLAPPAVWSPKVRAWLSAARCEPDGGARLMRILIDAADRDVDVLSRFYLLAYDWSAEPDDASLPHGREDIAARFRRAIDRAQGVEPLDLTAAGVRGGRGN
ncbi:hypothetical protein [Kitasatospora sp. NPDC093558]|uniref:hypothetical protein n=1 Tax=Kitasatospora sp. NPDC093558 TaxID=3155201 RepID=UPI003418CB6B